MLISHVNNVSENYNNLLSGNLLSFIYIMYFHFPFIAMGLDLGWNKEPMTSVNMHLVQLKENNFNQNLIPYA